MINKVKKVGQHLFATISVLVFMFGLILIFSQGNILSLLIIPIIVTFGVLMNILQPHLSKRFSYWVVFSTLFSTGAAIIVIRVALY